MRFNLRLTYLLLLSAVWMGCSEASVVPESDTTCTVGKCDGNQGWLEVNLSGRNDAIATFLKTESGVDEDGVFETNLSTLQGQLATIQGCNPADSRNFVISDQLLVAAGEEAFPRLVSTVCAKDAEKRWQVFLSPPEMNEDRDIDVQTIEMFAWDEDRQGFNFYKTTAEGGETVSMEVEPDECVRCHLGGDGLSVEHMPMLPVMNELTQPWEHWNAAPGFDSQQHEIPEDVKDKPNYTALTRQPWLASASELESTIRKAHETVANQRVRLRRKSGASVSETMSLLRPIFCDEQVNYVSESGESGQLLMNAVVDVSMREIFSKLGVIGEAGKKWRDLNARIRLSKVSSTEQRISMMPVRGESNVIYELSLIAAARGLEPALAAQVRLLDWKTPVFSSLRCSLWTQTDERLRTDRLDLDLESLRNYDLIPILMEEILSIDGVSLLLQKENEKDRFYILNDGSQFKALIAAISEDSVELAVCDEMGKCACDDLPFCIGSVDDVAYVIENHVESILASPTVRDDLRKERNSRVCTAKACYSNHPFIEGSEHCGSICPLDDAFAGRSTNN